VLPPTFQLFCNDPVLAHFSYRRYLNNNLREHFGLSLVPLRMHFRKKADRLREFPGVKLNAKKFRKSPS